MKRSLAFAVISLGTVVACGARTPLDDGYVASGIVAGDGGSFTDADADASAIVDPERDDAGRLIGCGKNQPGPALVIHRDYFGKATCIDATEVSNAQYMQFLASAPPLARDAACAANTSYAPRGAWPVAAGREDHPVVGVDWCDARAFCAWSGKALCRHLGPDAANPAFAGDPQIDEWSAACGGNRAANYPYNASYQGATCNGRDYGAGDTVPVHAPSGCQGADRGVYDLSGNVWEWEDACADPADPATVCLVRGGSFKSDRIALRCDGTDAKSRLDFADDIGFRCCVD